jgi:dienelactone hydrolase
VKSIIGEYGKLTDIHLTSSPGSLSFRNSRYNKISDWKEEIIPIVSGYIASPYEYYSQNVIPVCIKSYEWDGLIVEELCWQLQYGQKTKAIFLKPSGVTGKLPAVLALHDHGGKKFWGYEKIARGKDIPHKLLIQHQEQFYGGLCWANEIAKQGFAVLIHDTFPFASRRVRIENVTEGARRGYTIDDPVTDIEIERYNDWAFSHEHDMAKSLFTAGTTWPGVTLMEDLTALDILSSRNDVDSSRLACGGLSGGGMRTVFLAGLDERIKCAVCAGFMSTWKDFSLYSAWTHTWMAFVPGLPGKLDFPEILGLRLPLPTMVLNNENDSLYTTEGMKNADSILKELYEKAGAVDKYSCKFYSGEHKFDKKMQHDAFDWFKKWLM